VTRLQATILACAALFAVGACTPAPMGPTVAVMPAPSKPMEVFQQDDALCRNYAYNAIGGPNAQQELNNQQVGSTLFTAALGAALGAAVGGGRGAAIGAASGAAVGTAYGANYSAYSSMSMQQRYDIAYSQCMYTRGNQVPGFAPPPNYPYPPPPR